MTSIVYRPTTEEPRFAVRRGADRGTVHPVCRAHLKLTGGGRVLLLLSGLLFAVGSFLLVLDLCYSEGGHEVRGTALTMMGSSLVMGFCGLCPAPTERRQVIRSADGFLDQPYVLRFYERAYTETNALGEWRTPYASLYKLVETDGLLLLYHNKTRADILEKAGFTKGAPEELTGYLRDVCGISYKRIKSQ